MWAPLGMLPHPRDHIRWCFADPDAMSALPPKADMCSALGDVRFVPIADIALNTGRLGTMPFGFWLTERMLSLVIWKT